MIEIEKELFNLYESLISLENKYNGYSKKDFKNYEKCKIIDNLKVDLFNHYSNDIYKFNQRDIYNLPIYEKIYNRVGLLDTITIYRYIDSYRKKTLRLKKRISNILEKDNLFFLTFTFDDKKLKKGLNNTKQNVLRKYVVNWLSKYCVDYVGNIDFGAKCGRLHFHCVVSCKENLINGKTWKYGALNFKRIKTKNERCIALYVNKLCSHALKESTKQQYLIYQRKKT